MITIFRCGGCRQPFSTHKLLRNHKADAAEGSRCSRPEGDARITENGPLRVYELLSVRNKLPRFARKQKKPKGKVITSRAQSGRPSAFSGFGATSAWTVQGGLPGLGRRR